ncbi:cyclophilin-like fold protein [Microbacterium sp. lyk4-40-TSB-66]|uniref:cyclophilin-like fold protein n=1 Tax=Microbacterium sp. lyk4-40-TSB-66 TaxID=3040294 RepID=UPI0025513534|nr:cyclophilin-like fold protein [Microbacterium sp. lyk4-40-TSB-66]
MAAFTGGESNGRSRGLLAVAVGALVTAAITACSPAASPAPATPAPATPTSAADASPSSTEPAPTPTDGPAQIVGTVVQFMSDRTSVDVTIGEDSPGVRDFLSLLPTELTFEEFAGREKISYLPRELVYDGSPGSDPEDGDLIYFTSWGNLGFYYNADGIDYSDATLHIGTYVATEQQLSLLEGGPVTVEIVD